MTVTIQIDEEEIREATFRIVTNHLAEKVLESRYGEGYRFNKDLKAAVNAMMKEHEAEIVERCVPIAADYIGKKGLKKIADKLAED